MGGREAGGVCGCRRPSASSRGGSRPPGWRASSVVEADVEARIRLAWHQLVVGFPTSSVVISRLDGAKCSVPDQAASQAGSSPAAPSHGSGCWRDPDSDMALLAMHLYVAGERARRPIFHHVAERRDICRLAEDAIGPSARRAPSPQSRSFTVPLIAGPSSSPVIRKAIEPCFGAPCVARCRSTAATEAATPPLHVLRAPAVEGPPTTLRRRAAGAPGLDLARGTTSVWPAKTSPGLPCPIRALEILDVGRSRASEDGPVHLEAGFAGTCASNASAPPSSGVTEGQRIRAWARERASVAVMPDR